MTAKKLFKIGLFLIALTSAIGIYLLLQLLSGGSTNTVKAQSNAFKCGNNICPEGYNACNPLNQFECLRPDDPRVNAKCRYKSGGGSCSPAEFVNGSYDNLQPGQMAFCMGGRVLYIDQSAGYTYMDTVTAGSIRCLQSGQTVDSVCATRSGLVKGDQTTCGNPYKCPERPSPTPSKAKVKVRAVCDRNSNNIELNGIDFAISRGGKVLAQGKTGDQVEIDSSAKIDIFTGRVPETITNKYPNISPKNEQSLIGQDIRDEYVFAYSGCTASPTKTPAATPSVSPSPSPSPSSRPSPSPSPSTSPSPSPTRVIQTLTPTPALKNPKVSISKTLIGNNTIDKDGKVRFNITVKNIGDTDITNFLLSDDFSSSDKDGFLRFDSVTYKGYTATSNCSKQGEVICPKQEDTTNGRRRLIWDNMPPKSGIPNEDGVLTTGEEFVISLEFTLIKTFEGDPGDLNDNCSTAHTIYYKDQNNRESKQDINQRSCDQFFSKKPTSLVVGVTKSYGGPDPVNFGEDLKFNVEVKNTSEVVYSDIDFTDEYNLDKDSKSTSRIVSIKNMVVTKGRRSATVTTFDSTSPLIKNNLQDIKADDGSALGGLQPGESYNITLTYKAEAEAFTTCDKAVVNVSDDKNKASGNAFACSKEILTPVAPKTGANFILNFVVPVMALGIATGTRYLLK